MVNGPQGASYEYIESYMNEVENRLMPLVETGDIKRLLIRAPVALVARRISLTVWQS